MDLLKKVERRRKANQTAASRCGCFVTDVGELAALAETRQAVYSRTWGLLPASVVMNMATTLVYNAIRNRDIKHYIKQS